MATVTKGAAEWNIRKNCDVPLLVGTRLRVFLRRQRSTCSLDSIALAPILGAAFLANLDAFANVNLSTLVHAHAKK